MNVLKSMEEWKSLLTPQHITPTFKVPLDEENFTNLLTACYMAEVESRGLTPLMDKDTEQHISTLAKALTDDSYKFCIVACGSIGNGKTTLLKAFRQALYLLERNRLIPKMSMPIVDAKELTSKVADIKSFAELCNTPYLGIDDVGTELKVVSSYGNLVYPFCEIIEHRYNRRLFTYITTNMNPKSIRDHYDSRIADRLNEMATKIIYTNPTYRK